MIYIIIIWFVLWVYKNFPRKTVKGYFKNLLNGNQIGFSKIEFEEFGLKEDRENVRKEFDRMNESIDAYQTQVDNKQNKPETIKLFEDKIVGAKKSLEEIKSLLEEKDVQIKGLDKVKDDLHHQINMLKSYIEREL